MNSPYVSLYMLSLSQLHSIAGYAFTPLFTHSFLSLACACPARRRSTRAIFFLDLSDFVTTLAEFGLPTPTRGRAEQTAEHREISTATLSLPCASFYFEEIEVLP